MKKLAYRKQPYSKYRIFSINKRHEKKIKMKLEKKSALFFSSYQAKIQYITYKKTSKISKYWRFEKQKSSHRFYILQKSKMNFYIRN